MQSPRRSPRLSVDSPKRQSPRLQDITAAKSKSAASLKGRASTGALASIDKENVPEGSPSNAKGKGKAGRRAYSLGGARLGKGGKEDEASDMTVPSRRNVPGPRKSAIRALPPQVFASPTIASPPPQIKSSTSNSNDALSALGGNDLMDLLHDAGLSRGEPSSRPGQVQRKSSAQEVATITLGVTVDTFENDNTVARKKRRVTFNPYQERTDFFLEEPTIHVRPTGETELLTTGSGSDSSRSSDMSMDSSEDSGLLGEMDADEASMEIAAVYDDQQTFADTQRSTRSTDDDSAMDMTMALGGLMDRTVASLPSGQGDDGDDSASVSASEEASGSEGDYQAHQDDATVTMQFTSIGEDEDDEEEDEEEGGNVQEVQEEAIVDTEESEDEEVDMQLTQISEAGLDESAREEDSAMELTDIYSPSKTATTPIRARNSSPRRSPRLSSPAASSPRIGHEYCKIPAADSPKQNLSAASLKAQARRQSLAQSPVKPGKSIDTASRTSLGHPSNSPEKTPFRPRPITNRSSTGGAKRPSLPVEGQRQTTSSSPRQSSTAKATAESPVGPKDSAKSSSSSRPSSSSPRRLSLNAASSSRSSIGSPQRLKGPPIQKQEHDNSYSGSSVSAGKRHITIDPAIEPLTVNQFFDSLSLGFLDLGIPNKRQVYRDNSEENVDSWSEKVKAACIYVPTLDGLREAGMELKSVVDEGHQMSLEYEKDFLERPPSYIAEMASMTRDEERQRAIAAFRVQKAAARANALQAYYGWRAEKQFDDAALEQWKQIRDQLQSDVRSVREKSEMVRNQALPVLKKRRRDLEEELQQERKRQKALEECDEEEMKQLHLVLEEQGARVAEHQTSCAEAKEELNMVESQLAVLMKRTEETNEALAEARRTVQAIQGSTKSEADRLAREVKQIEILHLWTLRKAGLNEVNMELDSAVLLKLSLGKKRVQATVEVIEDSWWTSLQQQALEEHIESLVSPSTKPAAYVRLITITWARLRHLTSIYETLFARFPTEREAIDGEKGKDALFRVTVLLPKQKSKVHVEIRIAMSDWLRRQSLNLEESDIEARVVYGNVDAAVIVTHFAKCFNPRIDKLGQQADGFSSLEEL